VLKNKNDLETTASRKPLFHERQIDDQSLKPKNLKQKNTTLAKNPPQNLVGFSFAKLICRPAIMTNLYA